jgi:hypothetical protein
MFENLNFDNLDLFRIWILEFGILIRIGITPMKKVIPFTPH